MTFQLPDLPYAFDALEPHIDAKTMEIHHGKHHQGYTDKLNDAIKGTELEGLPIEEILKKVLRKSCKKQWWRLLQSLVVLENYESQWRW